MLTLNSNPYINISKQKEMLRFFLSLKKKKFSHGNHPEFPTRIGISEYIWPGGDIWLIPTRKMAFSERKNDIKTRSLALSLSHTQSMGHILPILWSLWRQPHEVIHS